MRPAIGNRIIELLLEGLCPSQVAKTLKISNSHVDYYCEKAENAGAIARVKGAYPLRYKKGPMYEEGLYIKRQRRRSCYFENLHARVHPGNGSSFRFKVLKYGDLENLRLPGLERPIFPKKPKGKGSNLHYTAAFPVEFEGGEGEATVTFFPSPEPHGRGGRLEISPPELRLGLYRLQAAKDGPSLFRPIVDSIYNTLGKAGWRFGEQTFEGEEVHYAFARPIVEALLPELLDNVPRLRRGDREADHPLFWDMSVPGGELETVHHRVAIDLLAMLKAANERTGRR